MSEIDLHPDDDILLKELDGELAAAEAMKVRSHLDACSSCRTRLEEFRRSLGAFMHYREVRQQSLVPAPSQPWPDLMPRLQEAERSLAPQARKSSLWSLPSRPTQWLAAAACLLLAAILVRRFQDTPSVRADELIRKAVAAQAAAPLEPSRRIRVRTAGRAFVRPAFLPADDTNRELKRSFETAGFSWDNPLSAASFAAWHDQLTDKTDSVETLNDDSSGTPLYRIHSTTHLNPLRAATLTLRRHDLRPVREMLEFTNQTVEIAEVSAGEAGDPATSAPAISGRVPAGAPAAMPETPSQLPLKLAVFSALHRIGADLGEQIEIRQRATGITVVATGASSARREQLRSVLAGIAGIEIQFEEAGALPRAAAADAGGTVTAPMQMRLQALLGSRQSAEEFTNRVLDASDSVMARVHALRALARAFPAGADASLPPAERQILVQLRDDHSEKLAESIANLQRSMQPVVTSAPAAAAEQATGWQDAVELLFAPAQEVDHVLNAKLAGAGTPEGDAGFESLGAPLGRLLAQHAVYERARR